MSSDQLSVALLFMSETNFIIGTTIGSSVPKARKKRNLVIT